MLLSHRRYKLAKFLLEDKGYHTIESLAEKFEVSNRTLRDDLNFIQSIIQKQNANIVKKRNIGIKLVVDSKENVKRIILEEIKHTSYSSEPERINGIIGFLLMNDSKFTVKMLTDYMMVGKNTIIHDLKKCEKWFNEQNIIFIKNKRAGTVLSYNEYSYRQAVLNYITKQFSEADFQKLYQSFNEDIFLVSDTYVNEFVNHFSNGVNLLVIKNFIRKYEKDFYISFSDESFTRIFFYLCVTINRIKSDCLLDNVEYSDQNIGTENIEWFIGNKKILENDANIRFSTNETTGILLTFLSQNKYYMEGYNMSLLVNEERTVREFIKKVEDILCLDLSRDENLIKNLIIHMKPAIYRMRYGIKSSNPLIEQVKGMYPELFKACKLAGNIYKKELNISFDDDEVSYIVMHIASSIEKIIGSTNYFHNVIVVCSNGLGASDMVKTRLLKEFPNIIIKAVCSVKDLQRIDTKDVELIVSTTSLYGQYEQSVVYVSPLLSNEDISKIAFTIGQSKVNNKMYLDILVSKIMLAISQECNIEDFKRLENKIVKILRDFNCSRKVRKPLSYFLENNLIKVMNESLSWEEAIQEAGNLLVNEGKITYGYIDKLIRIAADKEANFAIGNGVVMPHARYDNNEVIETSMSLLKLNKPIKFPFSEENIQVIIVLAATTDNEHIDAVNEVARILVDNDTLGKIKSSLKTFEILDAIKCFEIATTRR